MNAVAAVVSTPMVGNRAVRREVSDSQSPGMSKGESELLERLRHRDASAFEELVEQNHSAMIRMALGYVADRDVAEEVVQDAWLAVINGLARFEGRSSLRTWIFGILIHKAKDRGVREKRHINFSQFESYDDESDDAVDPSRFQVSGELAGAWALPPQPWDERTPEKLLANKQALALMTRTIEELPKGLREVLVLRDVEGLESDEICKLLKLTENNLYVRLHRARERVRRALEVALVGPH